MPCAQWNVLARGLADDGFLLKHALKCDDTLMKFQDVVEKVTSAAKLLDKVDREVALKELGENAEKTLGKGALENHQVSYMKRALEHEKGQDKRAR